LFSCSATLLPASENKVLKRLVNHPQNGSAGSVSKRVHEVLISHQIRMRKFSH
jgi:hypothetical protein